MLSQSLKWVFLGLVPLYLLIQVSCSKTPYQPPEKPKVELAAKPPTAAAEPLGEEKIDKQYIPPHIYIHPVQWHADFKDDVNKAAQYLLSDNSITDAYQGDKLVFPTVIAFFQDNVPGVGSLASVLNITAMAYLKDHYASREYKKTLEVPNGCEVLKRSGIAPPLVEAALTGCLGERFTIAKFPFEGSPSLAIAPSSSPVSSPSSSPGSSPISGLETGSTSRGGGSSGGVVFTPDSIFGAAGALPDKQGKMSPLRQSYLKIQTGPADGNTIDVSLDSMMGDKGVAFSGVLVFESVAPESIANLNQIVDSHSESLGLPINTDKCRNAIMAHPNFVAAKLHYVQFKPNPASKPYPPYSPVACTGDDWINVGRNMLVNGCATPWENCKGPPSRQGKYNAHVGKCARELGLNFEFVDEAASKMDAFTLVGMMVKEGPAWYTGELDEFALPECGLGVVP